MMKLFSLLCVVLLAAASAFAPLPQQSTTLSTALSMGFFDKLFDKPLHGHGSGENDLDEQWEAQQAILRERRAHGIDKAHLKEKYSHEENRKTFDVGGRSQDYNSGEMYVEESKPKKKAQMKMPWDK